MIISDLEVNTIERALIDAIEFLRKQKATKENVELKELYLKMYNKIVHYQINQ